MTTPVEPRHEYIVQFTAPFRDPRFKEPQLENNLYFVEMTDAQAEAIGATLKRMFDAGFIVQSYSVALAELSRVTPLNLRERLAYYKQQGMR